MAQRKQRKQLILEAISDCVADLVWYDRKEDDDLPRGAIEEAVLSGEITIKEMVRTFEEELTDMAP
jgi:hypothetical protein